MDPHNCCCTTNSNIWVNRYTTNLCVTVPLTRLTDYFKTTKSFKPNVKSFVNGLYIIQNMFVRKHASFLSIINWVDCSIMVYGLPERKILDSQFDIDLDCGSGHPDSDLQRNELGVIPNIVTKVNVIIYTNIGMKHFFAWINVCHGLRDVTYWGQSLTFGMSQGGPGGRQIHWNIVIIALIW